MNPIHTLSGLAHRVLSPGQFEKVRALYLGARRRLAPALTALNGSFDAPALVAHLRDRLGDDFELLMVHCSVNNLEPTYKGTALDLLNELVRFTQPQRTLLMPAFFFGDPKDSGAYESLARRKRFDVRKMPSQMGLLSELFRRTKGVRHSRHPIMRISALGPLAEQAVAGHDQAEGPCGKGSPFDYMTQRRTLILGIGKPIEVLTHVHHVEDVMGAAFPVPGQMGEPLDLVLVDGEEEVPFVLRSRGLLWKRDMMRLRRFMPKSQLREWRFHGVPMFAVYASDVTRALEAAARRGQSIYLQP
jgi:aminoglycoside 3-N-acetyltransferase